MSTERNQILNLLVEPDVELVVNGISASAIALHTDRAPAEVDVLVRSNTTDANDVDASNGVVEVAIWNGWTADEIDQGWLGEAGIRVGGTDPLILQCRDGFGTADFADLVVHIEITTPEDDDYAENRAGVTVAAGARAAAGSDAEE